MSLRAKFWLALGLLYAFVVGVVLLFVVALWLGLQGAERELLQALLGEGTALPLLLAFALAFGLAAALKRLFAAWPGGAARLAEQARLIHRVNPAHRLDEAAGAAELRALAREVNAIAAAHDAAGSEVQARIASAGERLAQETGRLAALMSQLPQAVLVCNAEGRILLYNAQAARLFDDGDGAASAPVGLGRAIDGLLDRALIDHALERAGQRAGEEAVHFVALRAGNWLRARLAPVRGAAGQRDGFVLLVDDVTRTVDADAQRARGLRELTEASRAALANIRAAAETLQRHPDIAAAQRDRFTAVIGDEAKRLGDRFDATPDAYALQPSLLLEDMRAVDLAQALQARLGAAGLPLHIDTIDPALWLGVDSYALLRALARLAGRTVLSPPRQPVHLGIEANVAHALLTLAWRGGPPAERADAELDELLARHGGEWWWAHDAQSGDSRLCVQLPVVTPAADVMLEHRPVAYDFDLFHQAGQTPAWDARALSELAYTVFDTETTGLAPADGDEIISIGAVRIVNGRLLEHERFERLVYPRRRVSKASQQVHGITPEMLAGQPGIEQVLPAFARYAEDTVLVAHNAAFDLRFLQLKEATTGVRFEQPVLDTLLLSALVHPGHADAEHRLESIAGRLGVPVLDRHTAYGDALLTGRVLLQLLPLLAERGIRTLGQAREASRKTVYAKLEY